MEVIVVCLVLIWFDLRFLGSRCGVVYLPDYELIGSQCLPKDFKLPLVVHTVKAYVDCYEMTEILNVLLEKRCSKVDIINGFVFWVC